MKIKKIRIVEKSKLTITWQSELSTLYEYRYVFVSDSGRIIITHDGFLIQTHLLTKVKIYRC